MSGISNDLSSYGLIGRVGDYAVSIDRRETNLTTQTTTGLVATNVADLGSVTSQVLDLEPQLAQLSALSANATLAGNYLQSAQTSLSAITSIASTMSTSLTTLSTESGTGLTTAITDYAAQAKDDLGTLMGLLNTNSGDSYVFGAPGDTTAPVPNVRAAADGPLASSIAGAVTGLGANGVAATLQSIVTAVTGAGLFSPSQNPSTATTIDVGVGEQATVGYPATTTVGMADADASVPTTGSSIQDLIGILSAVSNLGASAAQAPDFDSFVSGMQTMLQNAQGGLSAIVSSLGVSQQQVSAASDTNADTSTALSTQIGDLTSVDLPTIATQLAATQNQLTASYEIINDLKGMTLAAYL